MYRSNRKLFNTLTDLWWKKRRTIKLLSITTSIVIVAFIVIGSAVPAKANLYPADLQITRDPATGTATFLHSREGLASHVNLEVLKNNPGAAAFEFLSIYEELLGMPRAKEELVFVNKMVDELGLIHLRLRQVYQNVPVYGAEVRLHYAPDGKTVRTVNGRFIPYLNVLTEPRLSAYAAVTIVRNIQPQGELWEEPLLRIYSSYIDRNVKGDHLAWLVRIFDAEEPSRNLYVVDAHTGEILTRYDELNTDLSRLIYDAQNTSELPGVLVRSEGDPLVGDTDADSAYVYLGDTYRYFFNNFDRDSFDDAGADLIATVHYGVNYQNAFWNGAQMVFGDGFAVDDVTAHELSHAVTEFTADLIYQDESGALNESYSDIFGEFVDLGNGAGNDGPAVRWLMGEDLTIGAIRDMSDPPAYGDPDRASDYVCTSSDNGGVHTNSGIPNKAAYLMADGDTFNGYTINGIGLEKTGQVVYRALSVYLTPSSGFVDYYSAMNTSCGDLIGRHGITADDCVEVDYALLATEMSTAPECQGWATAYGALFDSESDLDLMRRYRDDILMRMKRGRLFTRLLYKNSEEALEVLNGSPELMSEAAHLLSTNIDAVNQVLNGDEGVIYNTEEVISFLDAYAREASPSLRELAEMVREIMRIKKRRGEKFLGFKLQ